MLLYVHALITETKKNLLNINPSTPQRWCLDKLQSAQVFTSIDLKNCFFHVDIDSNCTDYTAFITHNGQWEILKAPFGLRISSAAFNRYLSCVFHHFLANGTLIWYMNDFIIPVETEEGLVNLKRVLRIVLNNVLNINLKRMSFSCR